MITDERCAAFISSFDKGMTPFLEELEERAASDGVPIIRMPARSLLKYMLAQNEPERILEIGTAVGFSAIFMATYGPQHLHIDTIENYEKHILLAGENIRSARMEDRICLMEGDAADVLEKLSEERAVYDLIFMDAAKAQYPVYLPFCKQMLSPGGVLVSDNVLFDGDVVQSRYAVRRRDRTIHERMRQFLRLITNDDELVTTILPIGDGMTVSVKKRTE